MDYRAAIIVSCWFAVAVIASVYMWVFGRAIGDILFGVFLPVGLLVLAAVVVTFSIASSIEPERKREDESVGGLQDLRSKLNVIEKEIEEIKKERKIVN